MLLSPAGKMPQKTMGLASLKPGRGFAVGAVPVGDRVADPGVAQLLDAGDEVADLARLQGSRLDRLGHEVADLLGLVLRPRGHEDDPVARLELAVEDADEDDDAPVGVEPGIEEEGLEGRVGVALSAAGCA